MVVPDPLTSVRAEIRAFYVILEEDLLLDPDGVEDRFRPLRGGLWGLIGGVFRASRDGETPGEDVVRDEAASILRARWESGDSLILASAWPMERVQAVADRLGCFDEVVSLPGPSDRDALVGAERLELAKDRTTPADWLRLLRVHQWSKNILLFIPLLASHRFHEWPLIADDLLAFAAFCLGASSIYILNDVIDLPSDRRHPTKRRRPMAAGRIAPGRALLVSLALLVASFAFAAALPGRFLTLLIVYVLTSVSYSVELKRRVLVDVFCLAGLYTLRILAGGAATSIVISPWLMAFSMFLFLSLAFVKRFTELDALVRRGEPQQVAGRGYHTDDLALIRSVGPASGYLAVLVICLYVNDQKSVAIYKSPWMLWLLCPVLLYWITRVWFVAQRGGMDSDPVVFAVTDPKSLLAGSICAGILAAATFLAI